MCVHVQDRCNFLNVFDEKLAESEAEKLADIERSNCILNSKESEINPRWQKAAWWRVAREEEQRFC